MLFAAAFLIGGVSAWLCGGHPRRLLDVSVRWPWLAIPVFLAGWLRASPAMNLHWPWLADVRLLLAAVQWGALLLLLARNIRLPGIGPVAVGAAANAAAILANGGRMPVGTAIRRFGRMALERLEAAPDYFLATGDEPLYALSDVLPILGWTMISVGDIAVAAGLAIAGFFMVKPRQERSAAPASPPPDQYQ